MLRPDKRLAMPDERDRLREPVHILAREHEKEIDVFAAFTFCGWRNRYLWRVPRRRNENATVHSFSPEKHGALLAKWVGPSHPLRTMPLTSLRLADSLKG